jgi:HEAT repeat protein
LHSGNAALDRFVNKQTGETRLTADFTSLVPRLDDPREIEAVVQVMSDWNDDDTVRNEAIDLLRRSNYSELDRRLIALLDRPFERERIRAFFVQHLGIGLINATAVTEHATRQRLVSALEDRDLAVRREALSALVEVRDRDGLARLERGLDAPELAAMQDLTIYLYHRLDDRRHLDAIRKRAYDPNQMVRISAVYVLGEWNDQASRPALSAAAMSNIHALRRAGELALGKLTSPIPTASF